MCGAVVIVGVEEPVERSGAGVVGPVGPHVGPFLEQGPVDPFDLPVGLGAAGPDPHVLHVEPCEGVTEGDGPGVGERVVGHHGLDGDAVVGEEPVCTCVERRARVARLVRGGSQSREAGVVIDHGVDEMAPRADFKVATDVAVYHCDPHSPWQRGTNDLLRQDLPRSRDRATVTARQLNQIATRLNERSRESLG